MGLVFFLSSWILFYGVEFPWYQFLDFDGLWRMFCWFFWCIFVMAWDFPRFNPCVIYYLYLFWCGLLEKEHLCLFGSPDENWEVNFPAEEVPPELPEPALGINFVRDGMEKREWLCLVAIHSDAWLLSVAFFFGASFGFQRADRFTFLLLRSSIFLS